MRGIAPNFGEVSVDVLEWWEVIEADKAYHDLELLPKICRQIDVR